MDEEGQRKRRRTNDEPKTSFASEEKTSDGLGKIE
jgi:hypothetical protein